MIICLKENTIYFFDYEGQIFIMDFLLDYDYSESYFNLPIYVKDISFMFYNCSSLFYLSNISKWNTSNIINMDYLFYFCSSLVKFPDISNWKTD